VGSAPKGMDLQQSAALGRQKRKQVPRSAHRAWAPPPERPDPVQILLDQESTRVPELVGLRHHRMLASPFTFLRGAAAVMALDLQHTPTTGLKVQACGDAHLANFGLYGTPERRMIFDVNDFDETLAAPWEWDVKRLACSFVVAGRTYGHADAENDAMAAACVRRYHAHMVEAASMSHLEVWYARVDAQSVDRILGATPAEAERTIQKARAGTSTSHELSKLTTTSGGSRRFVDHPPLVEHIDQGSGPETQAGGLAIHARYRASLDPERRVLLDRYQLVDTVRKVVGVGSVGTRCSVGLLVGASPDDALFLQVKEAQASVLEAVTASSPFPNHAERVVRGQRLCQAASDLFLGWVRAADGRDYYVRQLADMKLSVDSETLSSAQLADYAEACGWVLARAHARSGDPAAIAGYLGTGDTFDAAVVAFANAYADQTERDFADFAAAARSGRVATGD